MIILQRPCVYGITVVYGRMVNVCRRPNEVIRLYVCYESAESMAHLEYTLVLPHTPKDVRWFPRWILIRVINNWDLICPFGFIPTLGSFFFLQYFGVENKEGVVECFFLIESALAQRRAYAQISGVISVTLAGERQLCVVCGPHTRKYYTSHTKCHSAY